MSTFKTTSLFTVFIIFATTTALAAQDYNSSRSNRRGVSDVGGGADALLREASTDASKVVRAMVDADKATGFDGNYAITVDVKVTLERCVKDKGDRCKETKVTCGCTHL